MLGTLLKWVFGEGGNLKSNSSVKPSLNSLYEGDRGIHDLHLNKAELRVWLPIPAKRAMDECLDNLDVTAAKYLREFLVVYLYGGHELLRMKAEKTGLYFVPPPVPDSGIRFSRGSSDECVPGMGKNIVPLKLHLPKK